MTTLREAVQEFVADYDCGGCGHFAAYAERFRAALAQDSWQPIATAPKTGRKVILCYLNRHSLPRTVMARWVTDEEAAETDGEGVGLESDDIQLVDVKVLADDGNEFVLTLFCSNNRDNIDVVVKGL